MPTAEVVAADLSTVLPAQYRAQPHVSDEPDRVAASHSPLPVVFAPRVWSELSPTSRRRANAIEARYVLDPLQLEAIGTDLGWRAAAKRSKKRR